jgi:REP element-mobilizing transposase RayT
VNIRPRRQAQDSVEFKKDNNMEETLPNRQSIRLKGWDYSRPGWYFVTVCTQDMRPVFGTVVSGRMALNEAGRLVREMWLAVGRYHPEYVLDEFVVMPNHVHGLVRVTGGSDGPPIPGGLNARQYRAGSTAPPIPAGSTAHQYRRVRRPANTGRAQRPANTGRAQRPTKYRAGSTARPYGRRPICRISWRGSNPRRMWPAETGWRYRRGWPSGLPVLPDPETLRNGKLWQRNYWDVIVRSAKALANIRQYIPVQPAERRGRRTSGEPRHLGNHALLERPKLGFLASRGGGTLHGKLPMKPDEVVLSGFLSPMERAVCRATLTSHRPVIWVKPWAPEEGTDAPEIQAALAEGRLLILSPFADHEAPSARRAAWCNEYVMRHCNRLVLGHLTSGGMLECLLSDAPPSSNSPAVKTAQERHDRSENTLRLRQNLAACHNGNMKTEAMKMLLGAMLVSAIRAASP